MNETGGEHVMTREERAEPVGGFVSAWQARMVCRCGWTSNWIAMRGEGVRSTALATVAWVHWKAHNP